MATGHSNAELRQWFSATMLEELAARRRSCRIRFTLSAMMLIILMLSGGMGAINWMIVSWQDESQWLVDLMTTRDTFCSKNGSDKRRPRAWLDPDYHGEVYGLRFGQTVITDHDVDRLLRLKAIQSFTFDANTQITLRQLLRLTQIPTLRSVLIFSHTLTESDVQEFRRIRPDVQLTLSAPYP